MISYAELAKLAREERCGELTKISLIVRLKEQLGLEQCSGNVEIRQRGLKIEQRVMGAWRQIKSVYDIVIPEKDDVPVSQKLRQVVDCAVYRVVEGVAFYRLDVPLIPNLNEDDFLLRVAMLLRVLCDEATHVDFFTNPKRAQGYRVTFDNYDIEQTIENVVLPYPEERINWNREII